MRDTLGLYLSVPFCRAKCTFCNFASDAFGARQLPEYMAALEHEIADARRHASEVGASLPETVDSVYFGGGTPSLLSPAQISSVFSSLRSEFTLTADAEITVECAPGQLEDASLAQFVQEGVNRLSFGAQSFVPEELRLAGRTHTAEVCLDDLARSRSAGIERLSVDLIAGLPQQTATSWRRSLDALLASGVDHASVYMLEVDTGSRLGREVLSSGARYGATHVPTDDECVSMYGAACELFEAHGLAQYEISNFARAGQASRHNMKYWTRRPYLGFGLDAHSMLELRSGEAIRFCNGDELGAYMSEKAPSAAGALHLLPRGDAGRTDLVTERAALEEALFLGLRLNAGVSLDQLARSWGIGATDAMEPSLAQMQHAGLLWLRQDRKGRVAGLTARGRALSNTVFASLMAALEDRVTSVYGAQEAAIA